MKIDRTDLNRALKHFARESGLIVGSAGVGKTYCIGVLLASLLDDQECVIVVPVSLLIKGDEAELRLAFGYREDSFIEFLRRFGSQSDQPLIVFDGYDAARDAGLRERVLKLAEMCMTQLPTWRVLVSARLYDAQYSADLLSLFKAGSASHEQFSVPGLLSRHFCVPPLLIEEVNEALATNSRLAPHAASLGNDLLDLIRIPFNLQLLLRIAEVNGDVSQVASAEFQVQLLQEFWRLRVTGSGNRRSTEDCLAEVVRLMVQNKALTVQRRGEPQSCTEEILDTLHGQSVLTESGTARNIGFAHNILFDFAVQALLLDERPETIADLIEQDEARSLYLRPSFEHHFKALWTSDRGAFWRNYAALRLSKNRSVRFVGRMVPAVVVAEGARVMADFEPLLMELPASDEVADAVRLILQAKQARDIGRDHVWIELLSSLSKHVNVRFVNELGRRSRETLDRTPKEDDASRRAVNQIGINMLEWALSLAPDQATNGRGFTRVWILPLILRTFSVAVEPTRAALRPILDSLRTASVELEGLHALCEDIDFIIDTDPNMAADIYAAVFTHDETSREMTVISRGIVGMTSNRAQDYDLCKFILSRAFRGFIERAPRSAVPAAIAAMTGWIQRQRSYSAPRRVGEVNWRGRSFTLSSDYSSIWFEGNLRSDPAITIANELFDWLASEQCSDEALEASLDSFADFGRSSALFDRLLRSSAQRPAVFLEPISDLVESPGILRNPDLDEALLHWVTSAGPIMGPTGRERLKALIEQIPVSDEVHTDDYNRMRKSRLLASLDGQTSLAAQAAFENDSDDNEWTFEEPVRTGSRRATSFEGGGSSTVLPDCLKLVEDFNKLHQNQHPSADQVQSVWQAAIALEEALNQATSDWTKSIEAKCAIARFAAHIVNSMRTPDKEQLAFASRVLLKAAAQAGIEADTSLSSTGNHLAWSPSEVVEASHGLCALVHFWRQAESITALRHVLEHGRLAARFQLANRASILHEHFPELFWEILHSVVTDRYVESKEVSSWAALRFREDPKAAEFAEYAVANGVLIQSRHLACLVASLAFRYNNSWAKAYMDAALLSVESNIEEAHQLVSAALEYLTTVVILSEHATLRDAAPVAREWLMQVIDAAASSIHRLAQMNAGSAREAEITTVYQKVVDNIGSRLYFNTTLSEHLAKDMDRPKSPEEQRALFTFGLPVLEKVVFLEVTPGQRFLPPSLAHHIVELLAECVDYDPLTVVRLVAETVASGVPGGYSLDSMALREVLSLAERLLCDHRDVLATDAGWRATMSILDAFIDGGFPEAMQFVFRLEEIFR